MIGGSVSASDTWSLTQTFYFEVTLCYLRYLFWFTFRNFLLPYFVIHLAAPEVT